MEESLSARARTRLGLDASPPLYRLSCSGLKCKCRDRRKDTMATLQTPFDAAALSSSPAFGTPLHPIPPTQAPRPPPPPAFKPAIASILPILLPPPTLRPLAFRTFTKKHNLTLNSSALQALATFVGRHCGSGWREEGTGERVLDEAARLWKAEAGAVIVEDGQKLKGILKTLEGCMNGGKIGPAKTGTNLSRQNSFAFGNDSAVDLSNDASRRPSLNGRDSSFGMSSLHVQEPNNNDDEHEDEASKDPRSWLKVVSAFEQPRFTYDMDAKHFAPCTTKPSLFPPPSHKTALFRDRYNVIHQRLLRNSAFQAPSFSASRVPTLSRGDTATTQQFYKLTPIANLLGRGGSSHLLLGLLVIAPTGTLALADPSGSISLDLQHAQPLQGPESAYFCPGMIVLVDGVYEEDWSGAGSSGLGNTGGVGGTIGGRFLGFSIGGPPVEKRNVSLGVDLSAGDMGGGFGWTDFLGLGSERAVGSRMRRLEQKLLHPSSEDEATTSTTAKRKMVIMSEVTLDQPSTLTALRHVLSHYSPDSSEETEAPIAFLLTGNFTSHPALAGSGTGSIAYKEVFDSLAAVLSDYPKLLRNSTWIFVPGDNDPWSSAFSAGASTVVPREGVPEVFTSRVRRVFAAARAEGGVGRKEGAVEGEAVWTSNPARVSLFGLEQEIVVFRDDVEGRFRRGSVRVGQAAAKKQDGGQAAQVVQDDDLPRADDDEDVVMSGALPSTADIVTQQDNSPDTDDPSPDYATAQAKKLILSLLPQSSLSPFPLSTRPVHWDYASSALSLYPLPHTLVLADAEAAPFALTFEGCHVVNPGRLVRGGGRRKRVGWVEYCLGSKRGGVREGWIG